MDPKSEPILTADDGLAPGDRDLLEAAKAFLAARTAAVRTPDRSPEWQAFDEARRVLYSLWETLTAHAAEAQVGSERERGL